MKQLKNNRLYQQEQQRLIYHKLKENIIFELT